jgi:hypothetical protein
MKCKHESFVIKEYGVAITYHEKDEKGITHHNDFGNYNGKIEFECNDCGFQKSYNYLNNLPKWLVLKLIEVEILHKDYLIKNYK